MSASGGGAVLSGPGRREAWLTAAGIFVLALLVRLWAITVITYPQPEDTAYYVGVARNLLEGRGLVSDALWSYATPPLEFPRPAFEVWLPLPSFLAAVPMLILGPTFAAAQWSSAVVGSIVAVLAWRLASDVVDELALPIRRARVIAVGAGATAAVALPLVLHSALPDSTMPFAALSLAACLLMASIVRDPREARATDRRVLSLGFLLGLAALTRNEAILLALTWAVLAFGASRGWADWRRLVGGAAAVALVVFAPWAIRDWLAFGSPLPGQAISNALSLDGRDIFAYLDRPSLETYLAAGPATLLGLRVTGFTHNLVNVLLVPAVPASLLGLAGLWWAARGAAVRPLVAFSGLAFATTVLFFPVATTWGTFLHAAGAVHVLLILAALLLLDRLVERLGARLGWTRPMAWLGPALTVSSGLVLSLVLLGGFGAGGRETETRLRALRTVLTSAGEALGPAHPPVITDAPIWLAEETGVRTLGLPDEPPANVRSLADWFGATLLVVDAANDGQWPETLEAGGPDAACFRRLDLGTVVDPRAARLLETVRVYQIECP